MEHLYRDHCTVLYVLPACAGDEYKTRVMLIWPALPKLSDSVLLLYSVQEDFFFSHYRQRERNLSSLLCWTVTQELS